MNDLGKEAEKRGEIYLKKLGYKILDKNYTSPFGEIDIIAKENKELVFIEIKFRSSNDFGMPKEFVGKNKQSKIIKTALQYIKNRNLGKIGIRFDVLSMGPDLKETELIKSAFESPSTYVY